MKLFNRISLTLLTGTFSVWATDDITTVEGWATSFRTASNNNDIERATLLLTPGAGVLIPNQNLINCAFTHAVARSNRDIIDMLRIPYAGVPIPSQTAINHAFEIAARQRNHDMVEMLLTPRDRFLLPTQFVIDDVFLRALRTDNLDIIEILLRPYPNVMLPDASIIDSAFNIALDTRNIQLQRLLLTPRAGVPLPRPDIIAHTQAPTADPVVRLRRLGIDHIYNIPAEIRCEALDRVLLGINFHPENQPHVRQPAPGIAFEVHNYANNTLGPVRDYITQRLTGIHPSDTADVYTAIHQWIQDLPAEQRANATRVLIIARELDTTMINNVYTFLYTSYPRSIGIWLQGFIGESVTAYDDGDISCQNGIVERILTGLRGIDADIDHLLSAPERHLIILQFFQHLDPTQPSMIAKLRDLGLTSTHSTEDAVTLFETFIMGHVTSHQGDIESYRGEITASTDTFRDCLETIGDQLRIQEDRDLRAAQDAAYATSLEIDRQTQENRVMATEDHLVRNTTVARETDDAHPTREQMRALRIAALSNTRS